jgi:hypothetical protein
MILEKALQATLSGGVTGSMACKWYCLVVLCGLEGVLLYHSKS